VGRQAVAQRLGVVLGEEDIGALDRLGEYAAADVGRSLGPAGGGPEHERVGWDVLARPVVGQLVAQCRQDVHDTDPGVGLGGMHGDRAPWEIHVAPA
jgi:hypothetical protein